MMTFSASQSLKIFLRFPGGLRASKRQHVTGLTLECFTYPLQGVEGYSLRLVLFQPPQRRVTYAGLFGQPIEGSFMLFQQLVNSDSDHGQCPASL
jgi:hypothetical protein